MYKDECEYPRTQSPTKIRNKGRVFNRSHPQSVCQIHRRTAHKEEEDMLNYTKGVYMDHNTSSCSSQILYDRRERIATFQKDRPGANIKKLG